MITSVMSTFITALPSGLAERRAQASIRPQLPSLGARAWYEASISADLRARRAYPITHSAPGPPEAVESVECGRILCRSHTARMGHYSG